MASFWRLPIYPVLLRIGTFEITSFGAHGRARRTGRSRLFPVSFGARTTGRALDAAIAGVIGGIAGANLLWVVEHPGEAPFSPLISAAAA